MSDSRTIRAPRGTQLTCKSWLTEAAYRMIQNNLDPQVAENPQDLVVYGGRGQAARDAFALCYEAVTGRHVRHALDVIFRHAQALV